MTSLTSTQAFNRASTISVHWYTCTGGGCSFGSHLGKQLRNIWHHSGRPDLLPRSKNFVLIQNLELCFRKKCFQIIIVFNFLDDFEFMKLSCVLWLAMICCWLSFKETNKLTSFEHSTLIWLCLSTFLFLKYTVLILIKKIVFPSQHTVH